MAKKSGKVNTQPFWRFLFVAYCAVMLWLLFGRSWGWDDDLSYLQILEKNINLTPMLTLRNYQAVVMAGPENPYFVHCVINLLGNILLFIPAGWLLPKIFGKQQRFFPFFFTCFGLILAVETLQLFTLLGSFDIDDLILNLGGMILGWLFYMLFRRKRK